MKQKTEIDHQIVKALERIIRATAIVAAEVKKGAGINLSLLKCLHELALAGPISFRALGERVGLTPSAMTHIIDKMEHLKLVKRTRSTSDRRVILAEITPFGRKSLSKAPKTPQQKLEEGLSRIEVTKKKRILKGLETITELMGAVELQVTPVLDVEPTVATSTEGPKSKKSNRNTS